MKNGWMAGCVDMGVHVFRSFHTFMDMRMKSLEMSGIAEH